MSEISEFYVKLDEKETIYRPGQSVHGSVKLKITKALKLKELKLECFGEAEVNWPESSGTYTKYCYNRRTYLELDAVLFPSQDSTKHAYDGVIHLLTEPDGGWHFLRIGDYTFTFYMVIPSDENLPPSLEGKFGHIRYWFRGIIKRGRGRSDIKTSNAILRIGELSLDDFEEEMKPIESYQIQDIGWPCCVAGQLELNLKTDKEAYCPGDIIHFSFALENNSSRDARCVQAALTQRTVYISSDDSAFSTSENLEQINIGPVKSGEQISYPDVSLHIPLAIQPSVYSSECIALLYYMQVNVKFDGKTKSNCKFDVHVPIVSTPDKTKLVTNKIQKCDASATNERNESTFCVTGKPHDDNARTQFKKHKNTGVKSIDADNISEKQVKKLEKNRSKSRNISTPDSRVVKPIFSHHRKIFYLGSAPTRSQQLHESYAVSEYL